MEQSDNTLESIQEAFLSLTERFMEQGVSLADLKSIGIKNNTRHKRSFYLHYVYSKKVLLAIFAPIFCGVFFKYLYVDIIKNIRGTRCLIPNNYFIWEFTRPISNCDYCRDITSALILPNLTREEFKQYTYSSRPMVVKNAASHWPASKKELCNLMEKIPEDAEVPYSNYVFLGYEEGAIMHLDYISRLMWQGQIIGNKTWTVAPTPECDNVCKRFNFTVYAGDIVLLDTRIWYHGTYVKDGNFSLTVTSEYG
ncbi:uncharacterized protein LOC100878361 isoform X3 [Megachile rotundata]|uniref:uncharacterized protein LOC100878361 isoform X3 n=1 Tax=Megachile rotundata TaxID=143995 RepID=UPI003FD32EC6